MRVLYTMGQLFCSEISKKSEVSDIKGNFGNSSYAMASEQDSDIVYIPNKNVALCM